MWVQRAHCKPGAAIITEGTVTANGISVNRSWPQWEHRTGLPCALYCCGPIARCAAFQARFTALTVFLIIRLFNRVVAAERRNSATPGRGLKRTRDFPANPKRFPALAALIWFGNPGSITQKISGKNLHTRTDGRRCHCAGKCNRERGERHEKKSGPRRNRPQN